MGWIDCRRGFAVAPMMIASIVAFGCGAHSSNSPPIGPSSPAASEAPLASAAPMPAPSSATPAPSAPTATSADSSAQSGQDDAELADELMDHHRHHHHGGVARFIAMSLDTLGTTADQHAAIESVQTVLRTKLEPARVAEQKLAILLADGISAGTIDKVKVNAAIARVAAASSGVHAAIADALNQLHSILDDAQRTALVDKVEAHWQVWKEANTSGAGAAEPHEHGRVEALARTLSLTSDQIDKLRSSLREAPRDAHPRLEEEKIAAHIAAFGAAFEAPSFDAKTLKSGDSMNAQLASWGSTTMAHFYEAVVPILTPEQRTKLAELVREHGSHEADPAG